MDLMCLIKVKRILVCVALCSLVCVATVGCSGQLADGNDEEEKLAAESRESSGGANSATPKENGDGKKGAEASKGSSEGENSSSSKGDSEEESRASESKENGEGDSVASESGGTAQPIPSGQQDKEMYVFINPDGNDILTRINPPEGYARVEEDGFGTFLREYPLLEDGAPVLLHNGRKKMNQDAQIAVFDMDLVQGDLQQCADSCIRLYAEYFYQNGSYEKIAFHLVNGFLVDFDTWRKGGRVSVEGNKTAWVMSAGASDSQETFEKYLKFVFAYASTLSVDQESEAVSPEQIRAGDFFLKGGSPGHVVMVLDVCENEAGEKAFLLGQGYMPAQQFHVLKNPLHEEDPWYYLAELEYPLETPEYVFAEGSLKRPVYNKEG